MKKQNMKDLMMLIGFSSLSMLAGLVVGSMKEKMKMNTCCVIDEL